MSQEYHTIKLFYTQPRNEIFSRGVALNESLIHLNLTSNTISDEGLCKLAEGLIEYTTVKTLKLFWNNSFWSESIKVV